jgi:colicin import membrane protein
MTNDLIIQIPESTALLVFVAPDGIDPYIEKIRQEALAHVPDLSTKQGRAAIASIAAKVAKSKVYLEDTGKALCDAERAKIDATLSAVMAARKRIKEELDALRDEVRKPLTEWENAEAARKGGIEARIEAMRRLPPVGSDSGAIQKHLSRLEATQIDESFAEYTAEAAISRTHAMRDCKERLDTQLKIELDLAELAEFKAKQAEQEQKDREAEIARQAVEAATIAAENDAKAKKAADDKRVADESHRAKIIKQSVESLIDCGYDEGAASDIVGLIIEGRVKNVTINF